MLEHQESVGLREQLERRQSHRIHSDKQAPSSGARIFRFRAVPREQRQVRSLRQWRKQWEGHQEVEGATSCSRGINSTFPNGASSTTRRNIGAVVNCNQIFSLSKTKDVLEDDSTPDTYPNRVTFMGMMNELEVTQHPHRTDETNFWTRRSFVPTLGSLGGDLGCSSGQEQKKTWKLHKDEDSHNPKGKIGTRKLYRFLQT